MEQKTRTAIIILLVITLIFGVIAMGALGLFGYFFASKKPQEKEVYMSNITSITTKKQAEDFCKQNNAEMADLLQIQQAAYEGGVMCEAGYVKDNDKTYGIGCDNVANYSEQMKDVKQAFCYGVKPSETSTILPFKIDNGKKYWNTRSYLEKK